MENEVYNFDFGTALHLIKNGKKVARAGWNGKNMYIFLLDDPASDYEPCIVMYTAQRKMQPGWLASQPDMLANDWQTVED